MKPWVCATVCALFGAGLVLALTLLCAPAAQSKAHEPGRSLAGLLSECQRIGKEGFLRTRDGRREVLVRDADGCLVWQKMHEGGPR